ncbi:hypothetical protein NQ314_000636 [Rhamnusium bicolor]|uniref:Reverse transcriptase zinc-binding domain-containing protein n=1 Tax=Rhamnusium bicolor TaxID=1586634 RepID=A0AAV8ZVL8_9CUCU|nr:hypothetical protein NQ314_000636 [Rhamnusium bicolor]
MVQEHSRIYEVGRESNKQIQEESNQECQRRWELDTDKARWTKRLIRNIEAWCQRRHGEIEYYLTQFLGGHGCFNAYLKRFGLKNTDKCWYCGDVDTSEHTFFACKEWAGYREAMHEGIGETVTVDNIINLMISKESNWQVIHGYIKTVLKEKETYERNIEKEERRRNGM